jgi:hypothetical protein
VRFVALLLGLDGDAILFEKRLHHDLFRERHHRTDERLRDIER